MWHAHRHKLIMRASTNTYVVFVYTDMMNILDTLDVTFLQSSLDDCFCQTLPFGSRTRARPACRIDACTHRTFGFVDCRDRPTNFHEANVLFGDRIIERWPVGQKQNVCVFSLACSPFFLSECFSHITVHTHL